MAMGVVAESSGTPLEGTWLEGVLGVLTGDDPSGRLVAGLWVRCTHLLWDLMHFAQRGPWLVVSAGLPSTPVLVDSFSFFLPVFCAFPVPAPFALSASSPSDGLFMAIVELCSGEAIPCMFGVGLCSCDMSCSMGDAPAVISRSAT